MFYYITSTPYQFSHWYSLILSSNADFKVDAKFNLKQGKLIYMYLERKELYELFYYISLHLFDFPILPCCQNILYIYL